MRATVAADDALGGAPLFHGSTKSWGWRAPRRFLSDTQTLTGGQRTLRALRPQAARAAWAWTAWVGACGTRAHPATGVATPVLTRAGHAGRPAPWSDGGILARTSGCPTPSDARPASGSSPRPKPHLGGSSPATGPSWGPRAVSGHLTAAPCPRPRPVSLGVFLSRLAPCPPPSPLPTSSDHGA